MTVCGGTEGFGIGGWYIAPGRFGGNIFKTQYAALMVFEKFSVIHRLRRRLSWARRGRFCSASGKWLGGVPLGFCTGINFGSPGGEMFSSPRSLISSSLSGIKICVDILHDAADNLLADRASSASA